MPRLWINNVPNKMPWWRHVLAMLVGGGGPIGLYWALATMYDLHRGVGGVYFTSWCAAFLTCLILFLELTRPYMAPLMRKGHARNVGLDSSAIGLSQCGGNAPL